MFLDATELASLRTDLETTLTDAVTVLRSTPVDVGGRQGTTYAAQDPGRWPFARTWIKPSTKDMAEQVIAGQVKAVLLWYVLLAWDADVQATDRLQVAGMTLEVSGEDGGRTDGIGQTVICRRIS